MESLWECVCGHKVYSEAEPEECPSCFKISKFTQLPHELIEERQKDLEEDMEELPAKLSKVKSKPRRKKK